MIAANVRGNFYTLRRQVKGIERSTGEEWQFMTDIPVRLELTSTQKLSVRQAGEMYECEWTAHVDPPPVGAHWPEVNDVFELVTVLDANDPTREHVGRRFDIKNRPTMDTRALVLSMTESER